MSGCKTLQHWGLLSPGLAHPPPAVHKCKQLAQQLAQHRHPCCLLPAKASMAGKAIPSMLHISRQGHQRRSMRSMPGKEPVGK